MFTLFRRINLNVNVNAIQLKMSKSFFKMDNLLVNEEH